MATCYTPLPALDEAVAICSRQFGLAFQLWRDEHGFSPPAAGESSTLLSPHFHETVAAHYRRDLPALVEIDGQQMLTILPLSSRAGRCAAVAVVQSSDRRLVEQLAAATHLLLQQSEELHHTRFQLVENFEQLTWLRNMAEMIEYCEADNSIQKVVSAILPTLREVVCAEAVVFVALDPGDSPPGHYDAERSAAEAELEVRCCDGELALDDELCLGLVRRFRAAADLRPVVKNGLDSDAEWMQFPGLQSCMLVAVAKEDHPYGWLLAINKNVEAGMLSGITSCGLPLSELEFGTFEATLMTSAAVMMATHARNAELFREKEALLIGIVRALINTIDAKDAYTCGHSDRVASIAKRLAEELGLDHLECERIYMTGLLHDVGKIGVPDEVLLKPGRLSDEEFEKIKRHPTIGYDILKNLTQLDYVLPGVLHHHESVDGRGYPGNLAGMEIPLAARILAVADAYDAMTSSRPYRSAMPLEKADSILRENAGIQWDADVVAAFFRCADDIQRLCTTAETEATAWMPPNIDHLLTPGVGLGDPVSAAVKMTQ